MFELERSKIFKKDISKTKFTNSQYVKYISYIGLLLNAHDLPVEAKNHNLQGNWSGYKEFHIGGDLLLIYKIQDSILYLVRIGTHSQLFK